MKHYVRDYQEITNEIGKIQKLIDAEPADPYGSNYGLASLYGSYLALAWILSADIAPSMREKWNKDMFKALEKMGKKESK